MPRRVVPICSLPSRRSDRLVERDVPRHDQVRLARDVHVGGRVAARLELVDLAEEDLGIEHAAGADDARLAADDAARDLPDLERLVADDDRVPGVRAALVAAHEVRVERQQIDDLSLAFVSPLRADDDGRRHGYRLRCNRITRAQWDLNGRTSQARTTSSAAPPSRRLGAPTMTVAGTSKESARRGGYAPPAMQEVLHFGAIVLLVSGALSVALLANTVSERLRVPAAGLFLLAAAVASDLWEGLADALSIRDVERIAVVALIVILFDGGMRVGWTRFRESALPIVSLGLVGTFVTAGPDDDRRALPARLQLGDGRSARCGTSADGSGGDVLRVRPQGGRGPDRDDPRSRVRRQRSGRDRADARSGQPRADRLHLGRARSRPTSSCSSGSGRRSASPVPMF